MTAFAAGGPVPLAPLELAIRLGVAALVGLAVGVERERSARANGPHGAFAGVRTFLMFGVLGGLAGVCVPLGAPVLGGALLAGGAALAVGAYVVIARAPGADPGGTTEAAALVVLGLGALAGAGYAGVAGGAGAVAALALGEKARLHWLVARVGERELRAALQFAVLAVVVLPLLPAGPVAALGGMHPRGLWAVVLLFSGLNFLGYLARRVVGPARGYGVTGLLGGLVSSTAVTLQFARQSRRDPALGPALATGVVGACTVLLPRVAAVSAVLAPPVARALVPYLAPPAVVGALLVGAAVWRRPAPGGGAPGEGDAAGAAGSVAESGSPLQLRAALQMAVAFQVALWAIAYARATWGAPGVLASAAALGLTDVDALTVSMSRLGAAPGGAGLAARAIAVGILANTVLKLGVALALGAPGFRRRAGLGLLALGAAGALGLWAGARW